MKSFIVRVLVGEFTGEGEGKSKKIAKKLAAAAALSELKKLPPIPCVERNLPRIKKKTKSIIKVIDPGLGPDSSLIIKTLFSNLPTFTAADQPGVRTGHEPHQPSGPDPAGQEGEGAGLQYGDGEGSAAAQRVCHAGQTSALRFIWIFFFFVSAVNAVFLVLQVSVCGKSAEGMGPSKKVAKRNAAEKMLDLLGYKVPQPQPPKPALKTDEKVETLKRHRFPLSKESKTNGEKKYLSVRQTVIFYYRVFWTKWTKQLERF